MFQPTMFASFNYGEWPSSGILAIGACLGIAVLVGLAHTRVGSGWVVRWSGQLGF